ncbi:DMT family transporter [Kribbella sp. HUAS MG21]|uniref:DMT family transporter n=1 Tax=Kribbella sp. HUAS MG21 TaxID=3160966 RepID=A0AAU7TDM9_9ACTN
MRGRGVDVMLLGVAAIWGSSYLAAQRAAQVAPVEAVLLWRYFFAAAVCLGVMALARQRLRRAELQAGLLLGVTQALVLALETYGVAHTSAANAGVLISVTIVLVPLLEAGVARRTPSRDLLLAAGVAVVGVALLTGGPTTIRSGDVLVLAAALVRTGHVVLIARMTRPQPGRTLRILPITTVQLVVGTVLFAPVALLGGGATGASAGGRVPASTWTPLSDPAFLWPTVYLALGCSVFAFLAQTWAVQRTSATRASLLLGTEPVWAVLVAAGIGGYVPGAISTLGAVLVVGACYWGQAVERRVRPLEMAGEQRRMT